MTYILFLFDCRVLRHICHHLEMDAEISLSTTGITYISYALLDLFKANHLIFHLIEFS